MSKIFAFSSKKNQNFDQIERFWCKFDENFCLELRILLFLKIGIFAMLDEECIVPGGKDINFCSKLLKQNSRNFRVNREMRSKNHVIRLVFGRISIKIDVKTRNRAMPKFQNLVLKSKFEFLLKSKSNFGNSLLLFLPNLVSRPKNLNSAPSIWLVCKVSAQIEFFFKPKSKILILY